MQTTDKNPGISYTSQHNSYKNTNTDKNVDEKNLSRSKGRKGNESLERRLIEAI